MLQKAGASLIAIHPRTRTQKEEVLADWSIIRRLRNDNVFRVPVIVNGDMWHAEDVQLCMHMTGADGYMSAQGLLHNPALFEPLMDEKSAQLSFNPENPPTYVRLRRQYGPTTSFRLSFSFSGPSSTSKDSSASSSAVSTSIASSSFFSTADDVYRQFKLARQYIKITKLYPPGHPSIIRRHLFFILFDCFQANIDCYDRLFGVSTQEEYMDLIDILLERAESGRTKADKKVEGDVKRARRRDGTLAPPPWPVGGGQLSEHNPEANQESAKAGKTSSSAGA